jgi:hypothetical protein
MDSFGNTSSSFQLDKLWTIQQSKHADDIAQRSINMSGEKQELTARHSRGWWLVLFCRSHSDLRMTEFGWMRHVNEWISELENGLLPYDAVIPLPGGIFQTIKSNTDTLTLLPGADGIGLSHGSSEGQTSRFASEARLWVADRNYHFPFSVVN